MAEIILTWIGRVALVIVCVTGIGLIPLGLPGTWVILAGAALFGWATGFAEVTWTLLIWLGVLAVIGELVEFLLGMGTARQYGASRWGLLGVFVGGIAGGMAGTAVAGPLGTVPGAILGAFAGAFILELAARKGTEKSLRAGTGALLGRTLASLAKAVVAVVMAVLIMASIF